MRYAQSAAIDPESTTNSVSIRTFRLWSAPQIIMIATNLADELTILPHAIFQASRAALRFCWFMLLAPAITYRGFRKRCFSILPTDSTQHDCSLIASLSSFAGLVSLVKLSF